MTDGPLMDSNCIHGDAWYDCRICWLPPGVLCRHCGEAIHLEESPPPFTPTWVHDDGSIVCHVEWAHPALPVKDNVVLSVKVATPDNGTPEVR